jgi:hypothetical protein
MMSKNSIVPFLKDYLIKFLTRPFLLDTNGRGYKIKLGQSAFSLYVRNVNSLYDWPIHQENENKFI